MQSPNDNTYFCPKCGEVVPTRKSRCEKCGYEGYIPMSKSDIKRNRIILFVILGVVAIAVLIIRNA